MTTHHVWGRQERPSSPLPPATDPFGVEEDVPGPTQVTRMGWQRYGFYREYQVTWREHIYRSDRPTHPFRMINNAGRPVRPDRKRVFVVRYERIGRGPMADDYRRRMSEMRNYEDVPWQLLEQAPFEDMDLGMPRWISWPGLVHQIENVPPPRSMGDRSNRPTVIPLDHITRHTILPELQIHPMIPEPRLFTRPPTRPPTPSTDHSSGSGGVHFA